MAVLGHEAYLCPTNAILLQLQVMQTLLGELEGAQCLSAIQYCSLGSRRQRDILRSTNKGGPFLATQSMTLDFTIGE